ncbi:FadR/GntR family transcriptional regulator [Williamsia limnetica]|uniref:FadR/GntR family transcriptional regulator n=1 Tax=Williamsia limnetica TaxID=882452 RepID=UPI001FE499BE|nr:GntR family transcriptional regulator [Williamsia limnetica]
MRSIDLVLGRERPTLSRHVNILPAEPLIPLARCPLPGGNLRSRLTDETKVDCVSAPRNSRVPNRRVAETIAADLRSLILAAESYQLPTQDELVRDFGVSYPSVREALRILETEGLVTVRQGSVGGADIHRPDGFRRLITLGSPCKPQVPHSAILHKDF